MVLRAQLILTYEHVLDSYLEQTAAFHIHGNGSDELRVKIENAKEDWSEYECFDTLRQSTPTASWTIPSVDELSSYAERWRQALLRGQDGLLDADRLSKPSATYASAVAKTVVLHRVFVTEHHQLGLRPQSIDVGDEVWFISGSHLPYVLRPISEQDGAGGFRLVGETYVHGCMQGEIFEGKSDEDFIEVLIR